MPIAVYDRINHQRSDLLSLREVHETRQTAMIATADEPTGEYVIVPFLPNEKIPDVLTVEEADTHISSKKRKVGDRVV